MGNLQKDYYYMTNFSEEPVKDYKRSHTDNRMPYEDNVGSYKDT